VSPGIRRYLEGSGVAFAVHAHAPIVSFADAKATLPFDPGAMVKGLAFRLPDGTYAIIGMRADSRADYKKIADALGIRRADLRAAEGDDIARDLDMTPGGVVPLPINGATVLFDQAVPDLGAIYCGTGRTDATLEIAAADLVRIAGGRTADLAKPAG
jgi:Cys-tRNA(Pro)/Cys-tRNA(Cys) deacylase